MDSLEELKKKRLEKLKKLEEMGVAPFAYRFDRTHFAKDIVEINPLKLEQAGHVIIAGRLMSIRKMGKAGFGHIMDRTGRIQIYVREEKGNNTYPIFQLLDIGDIIGVQGTVFQTRTGEITILVQTLSLLSKSLRPLPIVKEKIQDDEKIVYDAFSDKETRYRQRYVDLLVNPEVKAVFLLRSQIVTTMRHYLEEKGFWEVETPILQPLYGGALARPFITHHHKLDMDLYLRIADELYLKRLIVGGFDGVFEIGKDFRNEGMDKDHNPEFTMLELYVAYQDYFYMMDLVEEMFRVISKKVLSKERVTFQDQVIDFSKPWKRISYFEAIQIYTGYDLCGKNRKDIAGVAEKLNLKLEEYQGIWKTIDSIFSQFVEPKLVQPTFVIDYPLELSPLAKRHREWDRLVERFEGYMGGKEICNAFSELNDPIDQRERFEDQAKQRAQGNEEAMVVDEDYIRAMEYGMPPTAGLGIGIDRLIMIFADVSSIRDVIFFPQMRGE